MKILIAVEDKLFAEAIAEYVGSHPWGADSEFRIIHVVERMHPASFPGYHADLLASYYEEVKRAGKALVLSLETRLRQMLPNCKFAEEVIEGHAKNVIIDTATEWKADEIIVGSHGKNGITGFLLGSTSMAVIASAPCTVTVVKLRKPEKSEQSKDKAAAGLVF